MEKAEKIYEEVNIKFLVEAMKEDAEEYGDWHEEDCQLNFENGADWDYVCECPKIVTLQNFALEWMARVNKKWAEATKAHLPYCKPEGRKMLIPLYGGKLKSEAHKRAIAEGVRKAKAK